jgi:hypothetical protein
MIDAVMYGMIPSAKIEKRDSAEPENVLSRPKTPCPRPPVLKNVWIDWESIPGAGIHEPSRYSARMTPVKMTRRRSSGTRHAFVSHEKI